MSNMLGRIAVVIVLAVLTLVGTNGWQASSGRDPKRIPSGQAVPAPISTIAPVGTVQSVEARSQMVQATALNFTEWRYPALSGTPEVVYSRQITPDQLAGVGVSWYPPYGNDEPPMWIAVVHGDMEPPDKAVVCAPAERPHLDFVLYVVDEVYGVRYSALAWGGYGLGCLFNDDRLPGGFSLCTGQYLNRPIIVYPNSTPTRLPPGATPVVPENLPPRGSVPSGPPPMPTVISTITTTRFLGVVPLPPALATIVATPTAGPSPPPTTTPLVTPTPRPTRTPFPNQEVIR